MKEQSAGSMSVGKRTRNQIALREKELREKNTNARLLALGKHRKICAEKKKNHPTDDNDEEPVKIVSEAEYMRRRLENRENSPNVDVVFKEESDDSIQVVAERWNPLGVPFDNDDVENMGVPFDNDDAENMGERQCDLSVGYQWPPVESDSEGNDDSSDSHHSMSLEPDFVSENDTSSEEDDDLSDEDFRVDDDEMRSLDASGENGEYDDSADEHMEDRGWKTRESVVDDIVVGDEEYMQWLACEYDVDNNQTESPKDIETEIFDQTESPKGTETEILSCFEDSGIKAPENIDVKIGPTPEIFGGSENACNRRSCRTTKNQKAWIDSESESESEKMAKSEKSCSSENGGSIKRTWHTERKNIVVQSEDEYDQQYVKWISYQFGMNVIRSESRKKSYSDVESVPENDHMSESSVSLDGDDRQRGWLPKYRSLLIEPKLENDWPEELRSAKNDGDKKRGRTQKDTSVVGESEASSFAHSSSLQHSPSYKKGCYGKRGRPSKNWNNGSEFDLEDIGCSGNGGTRTKNSKAQRKKFRK